MNCTLPWFEMFVRNTGIARPCCYFAQSPSLMMTESGNLDIVQFWNGTFMQEVRGSWRDRRIAGTGCEDCRLLKFDLPVLPYLSMPENELSPRQCANLRQAQDEFRSQRSIMRAYPVKYTFEFGHQCNLRCAMCPQFDKVTAPRLDHEALLRQAEILSLADQISLQGGEPFVIPSVLRLIEAFSRIPDFATVRLTFVTNGTLLHRHLDTLAAFRRVSLSVSLDAVGARYDRIRKGASWQQTSANVLAVRDFIKKSRKDWQLCTTIVMMKSSLETLLDFVDWCISHDVLCNAFQPMVQDGYLDDEDIFTHPELLAGIPNWRDIIEASIAKLTTRGWLQSARHLATVGDELERQVMRQTGNTSEPVTRFGSQVAAVAAFDGESQHFIKGGYAVLAKNMSVGVKRLLEKMSK